MEAGHTLFNFYAEIFDKVNLVEQRHTDIQLGHLWLRLIIFIPFLLFSIQIRFGEHWYSSVYLNCVLEESLEIHGYHERIHR